MAHGGVSEDIKGKRPRFGTSRPAKVTEEGARFAQLCRWRQIHPDPRIGDAGATDGSPIWWWCWMNAPPLRTAAITPPVRCNAPTAGRIGSLAAFATQHDGRQAVCGVSQGRGDGGFAAGKRRVYQPAAHLRPGRWRLFGAATLKELAEIANCSMRFLRAGSPDSLSGGGRHCRYFAGVGVGMDTL
jgi:hypothetical protein